MGTLKILAYSFINGSLLGLGLFVNSVIFFTPMVELLGRVISPSQSRYLHTGQHKHRINAQMDIYALIGIRTHDLSLRASEDSSCPRPRGHCDRPVLAYGRRKIPCSPETPLPLASNGVWYAVCGRRTVGTIFFGHNIYSECCINTIYKYMGYFSEERIAEAWFQQYSATCHPARATMREICLLFGDRIVSKWLWLSCSPDLFLWCYIMTVLTAIAHEIWMNCKSTYPTLRVTFRPWCLGLSLRTCCVVFSYVSTLLLPTFRTFCNEMYWTMHSFE
jgi:hypothetical protein